MAHEINNPLGGLFNALDTLRVHGEKGHVRRGAIELLDRGLRGIRDVVQSALATYRRDREPRNLQATDLEDLRLLVGSEIRRKRIELGWANELPAEVAVAAFPVRQMVLNLLLNACRAAPDRGRVELSARIDGNRLVAAIEDSGPGMPAEIAAFLAEGGSPAPIADGTGLGLWVARRMAAEINGRVVADRSPLGGARVSLTIPVQIEIGELAHVA
jgi:signal transduction histidine kinase